MHSNIMKQIMQAVFGWIMNFPYTWDDFTFTIFDYFVVCCIIFVMAFFVFKILLFFARLGEMGLDYLEGYQELGDDYAMTFGEYFNENVDNYF